MTRDSNGPISRAHPPRWEPSFRGVLGEPGSASEAASVVLEEGYISEHLYSASLNAILKHHDALKAKQKFDTLMPLSFAFKHWRLSLSLVSGRQRETFVWALRWTRLDHLSFQFSALEAFQFSFNSVTFGVLPNNDFSCAGLPKDKLK